MAKINLLPWRAAQREQRKKEFFGYVGLAIVLMLGVILGVHNFYDGEINFQKTRNQLITQEIEQVKAKIKQLDELEKRRNELLSRMRIIEDLQRNRPEAVYILDTLVRLIPDGLYFESMKQNGRTLELTGAAQSNARVSALMRNLDQSKWFQEPELGAIRSGVNSRGGRTFTLKVELVSQLKEES